MARPNILMFNDWHFIEKRVSEQEEAYNKFINGLRASKDAIVVVEIGAGLNVPTIRRVGEGLTRQSGMMIRINPRDVDIPSKHHISLPLNGLEALSKIDHAIASLCSNQNKGRE